MCPALLSVCSWGGPELGKELRVFTGNTGSWRPCSWAPGARGVVVTGHSCGTPSPLAPLAASSPPLLPCECGPARQPVLLVAGRGDLPSCHVGGDSSSGHRLCHAAIPYPVPEGSSSWRVWSNLPVPSATPVPQQRTCTCQGNTATLISPSCRGALGEIEASVKKPRKSLYQYFLSTANLWPAVCRYRREQSIIAPTGSKCTLLGNSLMCSLPSWDTCHFQQSFLLFFFFDSFWLLRLSL